MILDPYGRPTRRVTETRFSPKLVELLIALSDVLQQNGLGLFCIQCHRLGMPDGVQADNRPESDVYRLSCGCATRVFHKTCGKERVIMN